MSNILKTKDGRVLEYLLSVSTPEYISPDDLVNPIMPEGVPLKFLKRVGDLVVEMTQTEKDAIIQAEADAIIAEKDIRANNLEIETLTLAKALVRAGVVTKTNLINAIKSVDR